MAALRAHRRSPGVQQWALSAAGNLICNHDGRAGELMRQGDKEVEDIINECVYSKRLGLFAGFSLL